MPIHSEEAPERATIPTGKHTLKLTAIKPFEQENTFEPPLTEEDGTPVLKADGTPQYQIRKQFIWQFESNRTDAAGHPFEYAVFTPRYYSAKSDKNKLTQLLRLLLPDLDDDERKTLDYEELIGRSYESQIIMAPNQRGTMRPQHTYFRELETPTVKPFDPDEIPA